MNAGAIHRTICVDRGGELRSGVTRPMFPPHFGSRRPWAAEGRRLEESVKLGRRQVNPQRSALRHLPLLSSPQDQVGGRWRTVEVALKSRPERTSGLDYAQARQARAPDAATNQQAIGEDARPEPRQGAQKHRRQHRCAIIAHSWT